MLRLRSLSPEAPRRWGRMSAHQMVCHLADVCRVGLGERSATHVGNALSHTLIKYLVLYTPVPIPKDRTTSSELDQHQGGTKPGDFAADVDALAELVERFASSPTVAIHPFFGRLSPREWGRFHYRHFDHHLRQFGA